MASGHLSDGNDETQRVRLSELVARYMGLHFPRERWADLQRGLAGAADEFGFDDVAECAEWLLSAPLTKAQLQVLASHLTIGETYFFREKKTLGVLSSRVLPELIQARRGREQRLRLWSAACCSGEEAYSLAILLRQILPDLAEWHVTILATDINPHFLRKAVAGSYGEWSFRDTPEGFKERFFTGAGDGRYAIRPEIKNLVSFEHLNLVEDVYPSLATDTHAMDVIFCRNVLMYFTPAQTRKVIGNLHRALIDGGWLAVGPSEASQALFPQFVTANFPGVILYQKGDAGCRAKQTWTPTPIVRPPDSPPAPLPEMPPPVILRLSPYTVAASFYEQGLYADAAHTLIASFTGQTPEPDAFSLLARAGQRRPAGRRARLVRPVDRCRQDGPRRPLRTSGCLAGTRRTERSATLAPALALSRSELRVGAFRPGHPCAQPRRTRRSGQAFRQYPAPFAPPSAARPSA
jgi:chemotaxis protein methyltransferase CheR